MQIQSMNHLKQHKTHPNNSLHFCLSLDLSEVLVQVWVLPVSSVTQETALHDNLPIVTGKEMTRSRVHGTKVRGQDAKMHDKKKSCQYQ
jgi:hypothetical protein